MFRQCGGNKHPYDNQADGKPKDHETKVNAALRVGRLRRLQFGWWLRIGWERGLRLQLG